MKFTFKQIDEPVFTTDEYYDLFLGGYICPDELLENEDQIELVNNAVKTIRSFLTQAEESNVIEIG